MKFCENSKFDFYDFKLPLNFLLNILSFLSNCLIAGGKETFKTERLRQKAERNCEKLTNQPLSLSGKELSRICHSQASTLNYPSFLSPQNNDFLINFD